MARAGQVAWIAVFISHNQPHATGVLDCRLNLRMETNAEASQQAAQQESSHCFPLSERNDQPYAILLIRHLSVCRLKVADRVRRLAGFSQDRTSIRVAQFDSALLLWPRPIKNVGEFVTSCSPRNGANVFSGNFNIRRHVQTLRFHREGILHNYG